MINGYETKDRPMVFRTFEITSVNEKDFEIQAIQIINNLFMDAEVEEIRNVLKFINSKYGYTLEE